MAPFSVAPAGSFSNADLKPILEMYRQVVAQRYTPCAPTDLSRLLAAPPFFVSRKIDGELWFLVVNGDLVQLVAANGRVATGDCPIIAAAQTLPPGTVLAGELHVARDGTRERVGDVRAALGSGGGDLAFAVFDLIRHGELTWRESTYAGRLEVLRGLVPAAGPMSLIPVTTTESEADVAGVYQDVVEKSGGEGIVVRCSDGRALKVKPEQTIDLVILGFTSRPDASGQEEARSLLLGLAATPETFIPLGTVGNFTEGLDRSMLLERLTPLAIASQYRRAASTGQLYQMIRPEILVECRVMDVQAEDSKGRAIRQPELQVDDAQWTVAGQANAATLINPLLLRLRDDKANVSDGARWAQIADVVATPTIASLAGASSEVIRRQVWTKTSKDKTDVRKLVVWKTNKEALDASYPAYVVHWTDYSAGRKTPLTREVRPAPSFEIASALADSMIADNIKKGWEEQA